MQAMVVGLKAALYRILGESSSPFPQFITHTFLRQPSIDPTAARLYSRFNLHDSRRASLRTLALGLPSAKASIQIEDMAIVFIMQLSTGIKTLIIIADIKALSIGSNGCSTA
jgi:hypothetical protein